MSFEQRTVKPYYGWYIAITLAVTETISWGILYYAFSVFLAPMEADLGWQRSQLTGGFSLALLVMGAAAFPIGIWIDRHGARLLMTVGSIGASLLVIAWSQVTDLTTFYAIWAGLGICAAAVLYDAAFTVVAQWFQRRRGRALAVVTFAAGFASTIFVPLSDLLLHSLGWRSAILVLGLFLGVMTIPLHAFMLPRRPADLGLLPDGAASVLVHDAAAQTNVSLHSALNSRAFWSLLLSFGLITLAAAAIRVHFIPFLIGAGIDPSVAAVATGAIGITQVAGRLIFAPLDSRVPVNVMVVGIFALHAAAMVLLILGHSPLLIVLFILIFGAAQGAATLARPSILAERYGTTHFGRISSVMSVFLTITGTAAPLGASLLYDQFGNYQLVLWVILILAISATIVFYRASRTAALAPQLSTARSAVE